MNNSEAILRISKIIPNKETNIDNMQPIGNIDCKSGFNLNADFTKASVHTFHLHSPKRIEHFLIRALSSRLVNGDITPAVRI